MEGGRWRPGRLKPPRRGDPDAKGLEVPGASPDRRAGGGVES